MHYLVLFLVIVCTFGALNLVTASTKETYFNYEIICSYPHDQKAFTQGLVFYDGYLYEGTGLYGSSFLRQVDLATGSVLKQTNLAKKFFGEGITILEDRVYQLTWREKKGFVYDLESFQIIETFSYPFEGWGLTTDGHSLIMSDGSEFLTFLDPTTYEQVAQLAVVAQDGPVTRLNELEYVQGELWANIWFSDHIVRIDLYNGHVLGWLDLSALTEAEKELNPQADVLNGIAYDIETERLFVTGKLWSQVYEIRLLDFD